MNGISYLSLDDELLELMYRAGFSHLNLALVSSDKTVRETTKRPHTLEAYIKVVNKAYQLGFKIVSYQILGLPNESLDSMIQTLAFNARLPVLLGASPFYRRRMRPLRMGGAHRSGLRKSPPNRPGDRNAKFQPRRYLHPVRHDENFELP